MAQNQIVEMTYDSDGYCIPYVAVEDTTVRLSLPVKSKPCQFAVGLRKRKAAQEARAREVPDSAEEQPIG